MATPTIGSARTTAKIRPLLIAEESIGFRKTLWRAEMVTNFLAFVSFDLIFSTIIYWEFANFYEVDCVPVKSRDFRAKSSKRLRRRRSEDSRQKHANPIASQTSCCSANQVYYQQDLPSEPMNSNLHNRNDTFIPPCCGDQVHNQQTDLPGETVNSPLHSQTDNVSTSFDVEAGRDAEAQGPSSNETSSSNAENGAETSLPIVTQNQPPDDDDGVGETSSNDKTSPHEDHKVKNKLEFVFMVGGQIIAVGIAAFALKNTSSMSSEAMLLQHILIGCMFASLICLFYGLWLSVYKPNSKAARVVWAIGYVAMALTLLIATGLCLSNKLMPWVTLGVVIFCFPAIILYAIMIV